MITLDYKKDPELFNETAKEWAENIAGFNCNGKFKKTKKTQIRNFYDKVLELYEKSKNEKEKWEDIEPFVKMLNSKVAYGISRDVVNCKFQDMMSECISQVINKEKLEVFKLFFEAVIGFYKGRD